MSLTSPPVNWDTTRPETALNWDDVNPGDRIKTYIPGQRGTTHRYEILPTTEEDSHGDLLVTYKDLETGEIHTGSTAAIGLSQTPDGNRYCWAIPDDEND